VCGRLIDQYLTFADLPDTDEPAALPPSPLGDTPLGFHDFSWVGGFSSTEAGARYYRRAKAILADVGHAHAEARSTVTTASGHVRVHSSPRLAQRFVTAALLAYQVSHPDVSVELSIDQNVPNLVEDGFDVSLMCASQLPDSGYVASTLGTTHLVLVASPAYLARNGVPTVPADLASHVSLRFLSPVAPANEWHLESAGDSVVVPLDASPFQVNTPDALRPGIAFRRRYRRSRDL
jgi:DNA-binding transcriptional LysR family regulator